MSAVIPKPIVPVPMNMQRNYPLKPLPWDSAKTKDRIVPCVRTVKQPYVFCGNEDGRKSCPLDHANHVNHANRSGHVWSV